MSGEAIDPALDPTDFAGRIKAMTDILESVADLEVMEVSDDFPIREYARRISLAVAVLTRIVTSEHFELALLQIEVGKLREQVAQLSIQD